MGRLDITNLWIHDGEVDMLGLEQFALSIAALSRGNAPPEETIDSLFSAIAETLNIISGGSRFDAEAILRDKAASLGFSDYETFRHALQDQICEQRITWRSEWSSLPYCPLPHTSRV